MRFVPNTWMDNLADEVLKDPFFRKNNVPAVMKTDIREQEDGYLLDIELPGFKKEETKWNWKTVIDNRGPPAQLPMKNAANKASSFARNASAGSCHPDLFYR